MTIGMSVHARLKELGLKLPPPAPAAANYDPFVKVKGLVFISGQLPMKDGTLHYVGKVGRDFSISEGQQAAKTCALNILAQLNVACDGNLDRVLRCVRLGGFVNSTDDFQDHPNIINGASDLLVKVFEDKGRHARAAVGVNSLPFGVAVEVDGIFEIKD